ncbi:MAG: phosphopentomutase [Bacteroidetes bacterium CG12_big_fil_rev_8_21_14_0_65_60_17]|nr:MAG: phosphopentomutase [Bacteroidetes bacterium CG12_big_fil_rev_8_21_14_0_65_60_17]
MYVSIILDGVGIGEAPDAAAYGDEGSDTLGHVLERCRPRLPNLERLGLGCIRPLPGIECVPRPLASHGRMQEVSAGKDSTTGHWEFAGIQLTKPFPTYPEGFPPDVVAAFLRETGCHRILGNRPESGTVIIDAFGEEHLATGDPIVYTSADSVFQIAAHVDKIPLRTLYSWCEVARARVCTGAHGVGRVIARPFTGAPGAFRRLSEKRRDYARAPHTMPLQQALQQAGVRTVCVGKIADLFAGVGFDEVVKTKGNVDGIRETVAAMKTAAATEKVAEKEGGGTFIWTNLIDFDQEYGHRNDPEGFSRALEEFDEHLPALLDALPGNGRLLISADHGNDPTTASTDHSREFVPLLVVSPHASRDLGTRATFADHAASIADYFGVPYSSGGKSFEMSPGRDV